MLTDHCDSCPWRGCSTCEFQGGVDPNAPVAQRDSDATRRDNRTDVRDNGSRSMERPPDGAGNTAEGLTTDSTPD